MSEPHNYKVKQEMFMRKFQGFSCNQGKECAQPGVKTMGLMDMEALDECYFIHLELAHGAPDPLKCSYILLCKAVSGKFPESLPQVSKCKYLQFTWQ